MTWKGGRKDEWRSRIVSILLAGLLAVPAFALWGCAGPDTGPVNHQISSVETMIQQARRREAEQYAPLELKRAEEKLEAARKALEAKQVDRATLLAEEAMAEARLAEAKSEADRARERVEKEERNVKMLRDEIDRAQKVD
jgi:hypothetical protein